MGKTINPKKKRSKDFDSQLSLLSSNRTIIYHSQERMTVCLDLCCCLIFFFVQNFKTGSMFIFFGHVFITIIWNKGK